MVAATETQDDLLKKLNFTQMRDPNSNTAVLSCKNLSVGYPEKEGAKTIAGPLDLRLEKGTLTAVVGVNGIGKSTLLRTLGQVQKPLSGEIFLQGIPVHTLTSEKAASLMALVLTEAPATRNLTVAELVQLGRHPYTNWIGKLGPSDRRMVLESLERMGLKDLAKRKCYELSDGQLQKVMIARALAQDTPLLLLDEPTTHLDLYHKVQILKLLKNVSHDLQKTVLFTTHEIGLAIQLCDHMQILDGNENPFGSPCELIEASRFDNLFPADLIQFDAKAGTYKVLP